MNNNNETADYIKKHGEDSLHKAAEDGNLSLVKTLIQQGYDKNKLHTKHKTLPIFFAAQSGHIDIVKYFFEQNSLLFLDTGSQHNLLYFACVCCDFEKKKAITDFILQTKLYEKLNLTPIQKYALLGSSQELAALIKKEKTVLDNNFTRSLLLYADLNPASTLDSFQHLIQILQKNRDTVLEVSISYIGNYIGRKKLVEACAENLDFSAVMESGDYVNFSPIHIAAFLGKLEIVQCLTEILKKQNKVFYPIIAKGQFARATPLTFAIANDQLEVFKYYIETFPFDPAIYRITAGICDGGQLIHFVASQGRLEMLRCLINKQIQSPEKINPEIASGPNCGCTPLSYAIEGGFLNIVKFYIEDLKIDPNVPITKGIHKRMRLIELVTYFKQKEIYHYLEGILKTKNNGSLLLPPPLPLSKSDLSSGYRHYDACRELIYKPARGNSNSMKNAACINNSNSSAVHDTSFSTNESYKKSPVEKLLDELNGHITQIGLQSKEATKIDLQSSINKFNEVAALLRKISLLSNIDKKYRAVFHIGLNNVKAIFAKCYYLTVLETSYHDTNEALLNIWHSLQGINIKNLDSLGGDKDTFRQHDIYLKLQEILGSGGRKIITPAMLYQTNFFELIFLLHAKELLIEKGDILLFPEKFFPTQITTHSAVNSNDFSKQTQEIVLRMTDLSELVIDKVVSIMCKNYGVGAARKIKDSNGKDSLIEIKIEILLDKILPKCRNLIEDVVTSVEMKNFFTEEFKAHNLYMQTNSQALTHPTKDLQTSFVQAWRSLFFKRLMFSLKNKQKDVCLAIDHVFAQYGSDELGKLVQDMNLNKIDWYAFIFARSSSEKTVLDLLSTDNNLPILRQILKYFDVKSLVIHDVISLINAIKNKEVQQEFAEAVFLSQRSDRCDICDGMLLDKVRDFFSGSSDFSLSTAFADGSYHLNIDLIIPKIDINRVIKKGFAGVRLDAVCLEKILSNGYNILFSPTSNAVKFSDIPPERFKAILSGQAAQVKISLNANDLLQFLSRLNDNNKSRFDALISQELVLIPPVPTWVENWQNAKAKGSPVKTKQKRGKLLSAQQAPIPSISMPAVKDNGDKGKTKAEVKYPLPFFYCDTTKTYEELDMTVGHVSSGIVKQKLSAISSGASSLNTSCSTSSCVMQKAKTQPMLLEEAGFLFVTASPSSVSHQELPSSIASPLRHLYALASMWEQDSVQDLEYIKAFIMNFLVLLRALAAYSKTFSTDELDVVINTAAALRHILPGENLETANFSKIKQDLTPVLQYIKKQGVVKNCDEHIKIILHAINKNDLFDHLRILLQLGMNQSSVQTNANDAGESLQAIMKYLTSINKRAYDLKKDSYDDLLVWSGLYDVMMLGQIFKGIQNIFDTNSKIFEFCKNCATIGNAISHELCFDKGGNPAVTWKGALEPVQAIYGHRWAALRLIYSELTAEIDTILHALQSSSVFVTTNF